MSEFFKTYDVGNAGKLLKDFFVQSRLLAGLVPYGEKIGKFWQAEPAFLSPEINYLLGRELERLLPDEVAKDIEQLSIGKTPHVLHLKGMPTGQPGYDGPEQGFPFCAMSTRALSALVAKRDDAWEHAQYGRDFKLEVTSESGLQQLHSDYIDDAGDIFPYQAERPVTKNICTILHFVENDGKTPTWFAPYNEKDADKHPDASRHIPLFAQSGDIIMFNNVKVLHGRGVSLDEKGSSAFYIQRYTIGTKMLVPYEPMNIKSPEDAVTKASILARKRGIELAV